MKKKHHRRKIKNNPSKFRTVQIWGDYPSCAIHYRAWGGSETQLALSFCCCFLPQKFKYTGAAMQFSFSVRGWEEEVSHGGNMPPNHGRPIFYDEKDIGLWNDISNTPSPCHRNQLHNISSFSHNNHSVCFPAVVVLCIIAFPCSVLLLWFLPHHRFHGVWDPMIMKNSDSTVSSVLATMLQLLFHFYRTRVRSLGMLVSDSLTHSLPNSLLFSKLDWCDPGVWRCQLKTCWDCYCCWCW